MKFAYVQYLNAYGEWQHSEKMAYETAKVFAENMLPQQEAFVRVCN